MHQQEVGGIGLLTNHLGNAGSHGNGGNASGTDQRIDLALGENAHQLAQQQTAHSSELKCDKAENDDEDGLPGEEAVVNCGGTDGGGQEDGDNVHHCVLCGVGESVSQTGLLEEVAQHQAAQQGSHGGEEQADEDGDNDGEEHLLGLGNGTELLHLDLALLLGGEKLHHGRLDQGKRSVDSDLCSMKSVAVVVSHISTSRIDFQMKKRHGICLIMSQLQA